MGLYKKKQVEESKAVSRWKNQNIWGIEESFVLYFSVIFLFYFLHRLDLV